MPDLRGADKMLDTTGYIDRQTHAGGFANSGSAATAARAIGNRHANRRGQHAASNRAPASGQTLMCTGIASSKAASHQRSSRIAIAANATSEKISRLVWLEYRQWALGNTETASNRFRANGDCMPGKTRRAKAQDRPKGNADIHQGPEHGADFVGQPGDWPQDHGERRSITIIAAK